MLALFSGIVLFAYFDKAIDITIINVSDELLEDVVITGGGTYSFGDIAVNGSVKKGIDPTQDSLVNLSHRGYLKMLTVDTHVARGYTGKITIELNKDSVEKTFDSVEY